MAISGSNAYTKKLYAVSFTALLISSNRIHDACMSNELLISNDSNSVPLLHLLKLH